MARLFSARTIVLGALAAAALKNRQRLADLLGGAPSAPEPYHPPASAPVGAPAVEPHEPAPAPPIANADAAGPPENTATHVPAPEPIVHDPSGGIDEAAEEAAAAAEAANIGGGLPDYPSEDDLLAPADDAMRPLEEAGEGYAEGQELAEADLVDNAEPAAGDPVEGERQVADVIEGQENLITGEVVEGTPMGEAEPVPDEAPAEAPPPPGETPAAEKSSAVWKPEDEPAPEPPPEGEGSDR